MTRTYDKEKNRQTLIEKHGSWEMYIQHRYHNPKAVEDRLKAASAGGRASGNRPFRDIEKAREAGKKSRKAKRVQSNQG